MRAFVGLQLVVNKRSCEMTDDWNPFVISENQSECMQDVGSIPTGSKTGGPTWFRLREIVEITSRGEYKNLVNLRAIDGDICKQK